MTALARHADIAGEYRAAIKRGELKPGERLPIQPEMAEEHAVSVFTVHRAMNKLREEGLIYTTHNGTYVGPRPAHTERTLPADGTNHARCHTRPCKNILEISKMVSIYDLLKMTGWIYRGTQLGRVYYCHQCAPKVKARERGAEG